jgi:hypothetical protein
LVVLLQKYPLKRPYLTINIRYSGIFFVLLKLCFYVWSFAPKLVGLVWGLLANGLAFCGLSFSSNVIGLLWAEL